MSRRTAGALGAVCVAALGWLVFVGWDYYRLAGAERPTHLRHALLRSSGTVGLACGVGAAILFVSNLTYLLRKRFLFAHKLGSLRAWMSFHVLTGLSAAGLVVVHSALLVKSTLGLLAVTGLGIVIVTGVIGRYIYAHVPRTLEGRELERDELRRRLAEHRTELAQYGLDPTLLGMPAAVPEAKGLFARLWGIVVGDRALRHEYSVLRDAVRNRPELRPLAGRVLPTARRFARDSHRLARYAELRGLMGSWRFLHRWLAVAMLAIVGLHVFVAWRYGDLRWPR